MTARQPFPGSITVRVFTRRFDATPFGARSARYYAVRQVHDWGLPRRSRDVAGCAWGRDCGGKSEDLLDNVSVIVAELAANAVTHGRVLGRDFELRLTLTPETLRIEVSDTRTERRPPGPGEVWPQPLLAESGRGLVLVEALADRWEVLDREPIGKTVRAELDLPR